jgi:polyisoprenoid-binding protein YceI
MKKLFIPIVTIIISLSACGGEREKTKRETTTEASKTVETNCLYNYAENSAVVKWTAFKTTSKLAVGGQFNNVTVNGGTEFAKLSALLQTISFNIPVASTNTTNPGRDSLIVNAFFGTMINTDTIVGNIIAATGGSNGTCTVNLTLNDVVKKVELNYALVADTVTVSGAINVLNFGASDALTAMNNACGLLHTGEDGISKTWPNVDLGISATLNKNCE